MKKLNIRLTLITLATILMSFGYQFTTKPPTVTPELEWAVCKIKSAIFIAVVIVIIAMKALHEKDDA